MDDLERRAFEERYELTATAEAIGGSVQTAQGITQGIQSQVNAWKYAENVEVIDSLFSPEGLDGENSPVFVVGDGTAIVARVAQYNAPVQRSLEEVKDSIREELQLESALSQIEADKMDALSQLQAGDSVSAVARAGKTVATCRAYQPRWRHLRGFSRIPKVFCEAFALPRPAPGAKSVGSVTGPDGSALVVVTRVVVGDVDATSEVVLTSCSRGHRQSTTTGIRFSQQPRVCGVSRADN